MLRRWRYQRRCRLLADCCDEPRLADYLRVSADLKPGDLANTPLIAVDLELTGLDASKNQIVAMGWTQLDHGRIRFGSNRHILVKADHTVGASAAFHELMDNDLARGEPLAAGLDALFEAAQGRVWVFHHAPLDLAFLKAACIAWAGIAPPMAVIDTMLLEKTYRLKSNQPVRQGGLQLGRLRESYELPAYSAHDALIDACATAELFLAQAAKRGGANSLRLAPHVRYFY